VLRTVAFAAQELTAQECDHQVVGEGVAHHFGMSRQIRFTHRVSLGVVNPRALGNGRETRLVATMVRSYSVGVCPSRPALGVVLSLLLALCFSCSVADLTSGGPLDSTKNPQDDGESGINPHDAGDMRDSEAGSSDVAGSIVLDASSWPAPNGAATIENALNQRFLDVGTAIASKDNSSPVVTSSGTGGLSQSWAFTLQSDGSYEISNQASGLCLDDPAGLSTDGTSMQEYQCWLGANYNQRWYLVNYLGSLHIVGEASGKCLTSTADQDNAAVTIWGCTQSTSQQWILSD
jgi:hypothetical protein